MNLEVRLPTPLHALDLPEFRAAGVEFLMKRDDLVHPEVPGNKWRKLLPNLMEAQRLGHETILTFGGAYSNHIYAVANAAKLFGMRSIGLIRGEEHLPLNPVLSSATSAGMSLYYLDRETYRTKGSPEFVAQLQQRFGDFYLTPEGGSNALGVHGVAESVREIEVPFQVICCPVGTGGTLAGLASAVPAGAHAVGFAVLKGAAFLNADVRQLLTEADSRVERWALNLDYHFGGYAKVPQDLALFVRAFHADHGIELDPIYTGKMMYGLIDLARRGHFRRGTTVIAVHTGGIPSEHWFRLLPARASA